jgi:hypothetical protein
MVLDWFGRSKRASISELIARKNYVKAIESIKQELQKRRTDRRLRLQLADVLALAGRTKEAADVLNGLADDIALAGFASQAIAVLKRIQTLQPGRTDIEEKLVYLIGQQSRPAPDPWAVRRARPSAPDLPEFGMEEAAPDAPGSGPELGMEEIESEPATSEPSPEPPAEDVLRDELVALLEEVLMPAPSQDPPPPSAAIPETALFTSFSSDELLAVVRGLKLLRFEPGEIIVTEGEGGASLFILTAGRVRAFVRHASGRNVQVRELSEGDFFGEIAVLTGKPRTATVTAASSCELLELDVPTLDGICATHPRVREVLQQFHDARANSTLEATIRGMTLHS